MSHDYFDDEFMEGIPSIAPDLMFVEESTPSANPPLPLQPPVPNGDNVASSSNIEMVDVKQLDEEVLAELLEDPDLETTIEIDSPDVTKEMVDSPLPPEYVKEEDRVKEEEKPTAVILTPLEKESLLNLIIDDHAYAKPFPDIPLKKEKEENSTIVYSPISSVLKLHPSDLPPKKRYKKRGPKSKLLVNEDDVDVVTVEKPDEMLVKYDASRGRHVMNEVEAYLNSLWKDIDKDEEEKIARGSWSKEQARLFDSVHGAINNYLLAKLTHSQKPNEPVLRKLALEKATSRVRKAFGSVIWNSKLVVWLHGIMIDGLCSSFFLCYLEILQALKRKVPSLFERIFLNDKFAREKEETAGLSNLGATLRKTWEPAVGLNTKLTMEKFPTSPFLITIPCGPSVPHQSTKRNRFWNYQLMNMGKSVPISVPAYRTPEGYVVKHYLEHCISAVRSKTSEFSARFSDRPIVLVGWNVGSLIAMKVALLDKVDAVVCLGLPCNHIKGDESQEYWDTFIKIGCPVLFVLGTHASSTSIEKVDSLRQRMKVHTNLIIMESGDELLRLTKSHKRSLGMTQNMIDRLIQDQLYLFLRDVLYKPIQFSPQIKELPSAKKKKKKMGSAISTAENMAKEENNKKRKKSKQFQLLTTTSHDSSSPYTFSPLDVSVGLHADKVESQLEGLLTTSGSISTPIPVTQMQSESLLLAPTSMSNLTVVATTETTSSTKHILQKTGQKRSSSSKEKIVRKKVSKKPVKTPQNFTASLGNQRAGNLFGQRFSTTVSNRSSTGQQQQTATLQRLPSGTFVLSGATGPVKLQNGNNIVYLQQLTSSGGTTQVIQTPLIANANGTFSTVPIVSSHQQKSSSSATTIPTSGVLFSSSVPLSTTATTTSVTSNLQPVSSISQAATHALAASLPPFKSTSTAATTDISHISGICPQGDVLTEGAEIAIENKPIVEENSVDTSPNLPVSLANFILSLPASGASGLSLEASAKAQNLIQRLSEEDLKTLATVLGRYSTTNSPKSSASPSPAMTPELDRSPLQSPSSASASPSPLEGPQLPVASPKNTKDFASKSKMLSMFDQKISTSGSSNALQSLKKVSHPLSLTQKVTAIQQDMNKIRSPRLKAPRIITTGITTNKINTATTISKTMQSKTQKVPITITIPISRLPSNFQLTTSSSKTINVPALSAYLAQQKFVLSTGKSSNLDSRTVLLSSSNVKKMGGSIMVSTNSNKNPSVFTANKQSQKVGSSSGKPSATITLHLPAQSAQKETLKKAASDAKLAGVFNQKLKSNQLVSVPPFKGSTLSGSPMRLNQSAEEFSPILPRKKDELTLLTSLDPTTVVDGNIAAGGAISTTTTNASEFDVFDESDIDFFVQPNSSVPSTAQQFPLATVSAGIPIQQKHIVTASKIIRVPVSTGERNNRSFNNKNILELPKTKLSENQLMNSARKVGVAFQQRNVVDPKPFDTKDGGATTTDNTIFLEGNKLKFEPLNTASSRPNLSSVLSSMRETGKIVMDEHGQLRNTIVAKPTVVSSKTAAMIARTAFMTDTKLGAKTISFSSLNSSKSNTINKTVTPALFSGGKSPSNASVISTPAATIRTATTSKVLPVTMKSNDFIRMSTQVRVQQQNAVKQMIPKVIKKDASKLESKSKAMKKAAAVEPEPKKEPPPYVTRSGRVLRTRYSFGEEMERKSPKKRRRTISTSKDESIEPPPVTPTTPTTPLSNIGSSLDSLLEAAKLITTNNENANNISLSTDTNTLILDNEIQPVSSLPNIDSTTNIAATAMLELLSSNTTGIGKTNEDIVIRQTPQHRASEYNLVEQAAEGLSFNCNVLQEPPTAPEAAKVQFVDEGSLQTDQLTQLIANAEKTFSNKVMHEQQGTTEILFTNELTGTHQQEALVADNPQTETKLEFISPIVEEKSEHRFETSTSATVVEETLKLEE